jgi:hypothetical protein
MLRRIVLALVCAAAALATVGTVESALAQRAFGRQWGRSYKYSDWDRLYHYPYVFYPQNFWSSEYFESADNMYFRYPPEMRIPVYNKQWQNYYPEPRRYHQGHHFYLDVF